MPQRQPRIQTGSCLCGGVSFSIEGELRPIIACHCQQCRKSTGNYVVATSAPDAAMTFISDQSLRWYRSSARAQRGFCSNCGGSLFWKPDGDARMSILAGVLDGPTGLTIKKHIFVADKADYTEIPEGVECLARW